MRVRCFSCKNAFEIACGQGVWGQTASHQREKGEERCLVWTYEGRCPNTACGKFFKIEIEQWYYPMGVLVGTPKVEAKNCSVLEGQCKFGED